MNDKNQVLLQIRSATKKNYPNTWTICTSHVELNESSNTGAIREIKEELGISINSNKLYPLFIIRELDIQNTYFFYIRCNLLEKDFKIQEEELSSVKWFDIDEIINMIKNDNREIVYKKNRIKLFEYLKTLSN